MFFLPVKISLLLLKMLMKPLCKGWHFDALQQLYFDFKDGFLWNKKYMHSDLLRQVKSTSPLKYYISVTLTSWLKKLITLALFYICKYSELIACTLIEVNFTLQVSTLR